MYAAAPKPRAITPRERSREDGIERNTGAGRQSLRVNLDQMSARSSTYLSSAYNRSVNDRGWNNNCNNYACHGYAFAYLPSFIDISRRNPDGTYIDPRRLVHHRQVEPAPARRTGREPRGDEPVHGRFNLGWNTLQTHRQSLRFVAGGGLTCSSEANEVWTPNELYFEQSEIFPGEAIQSGGRSLYHNWNVNAIHTLDGEGWSATTSAGLQYEDRRLSTSMIRTQYLLPGERT